MEPFTTAWEVRRYDAVSDSWKDVGPHFPGSVTDLGHTAQGEPVACDGAACCRLQSGRWELFGIPAPGSGAVANTPTHSADGALYVLAREGPALGMAMGPPCPPQVETPSARLYRYVP